MVCSFTWIFEKERHGNRWLLAIMISSLKIDSIESCYNVTLLLWSCRSHMMIACVKYFVFNRFKSPLLVCLLHSRLAFSYCFFSGLLLLLLLLRRTMMMMIMSLLIVVVAVAVVKFGLYILCHFCTGHQRMCKDVKMKNEAKKPLTLTYNFDVNFFFENLHSSLDLSSQNLYLFLFLLSFFSLA